jgi:anti-sigma regulatory factor (Ser/Thr protein kinase)
MGEGKSFSARVRAGDDPAPAILAAVAAAEQFIEGAQIAQALAARLLIVVEELVSNALRHGGAGRDCEAALRLAAIDGGVRLELEDTGRAFDPFAERPFAGPDRETGGGVGLELVRRWAGDTSYRYAGGRNRVCLTLR